MFKSTMLIVFFLSNSFNSYSNLSTRSYIDGDFSYCEKSSESKLSLIDSIFTSGIIYSEENKLKSEIVDDMVLDSILYFSNNLDSGASGLTEKDVIEYKLNGLQIKKTHQVLNSSDNWVTKTVEEKEYDPNGNLLMECEYSLDENGLPQVGGNKIGYTYNTENNVETITYYSWSFVTRWFIPSVKRTQTRGIEDNSIEILVQRYDEEREEWLNDERKFYLNIPDSIVEEIEYVWDTNIEQWRLFSSRKKTFYLQNGNLNYIDERKGYHEYTGELSSRSKSEYFSLNTPDTLYYSITTSFDFKDSVWTNGTKRVMTISETGWETDYRYSYSSLNGWIGGWQYKYKTNQESFLTTYVSHQDSIIQSENYVISGGYAEYPFYCKFKKQDSIWVGEKKQEKQFNSNNQLTEERNYTWNNELFVWYISFRKTNFYNLNNQISSSFEYSRADISQQIEVSSYAEYFYDELNNLVLSSTTTWDKDKEEWINKELHYFYSELNNTSVPRQLNEKNFEMYPNPTSGSLTISINSNEIISVQLYTSLGEKVSEYKLVSGNNTIDLSDLKPGLYLLKFPINSQFSSRRLIKL